MDELTWFSLCQPIQLQNEQRRQEKAETLAYLARERDLAEDEARKATASVALKKMQFRSDLDYQIQQRQMSKQRQHEEKYHDLEAQNDSLAAWKREQEQEKVRCGSVASKWLTPFARIAVSRALNSVRCWMMVTGRKARSNGAVPSGAAPSCHGGRV